MSSSTDLSNLDNQVSSVRGTGAFTIPAGITSQRPTNSEPGMLRWNTTTNNLEFYGPDKWNQLLSKDEIEDRFVEMDAPVINAPLDATGQKLTNVGNPSDSGDAVNLGFMNTRLASGQGINAETLGGFPFYYYASQQDLSDMQTIVDQVQTNLDTHIADLDNPHETTKEQVGLGLADNTSDMNKPISTAQQAALNTKVNRGGDIMQGPLSMGYQNLIEIMNFVGSIWHFARENPPAGFLVCNGAAVSRTNYPRLFEVIGTRFGAGDGSTTFNLPDLRGMFVRGWAGGPGYPTDPGRVLGSYQADSNKRHTHTLTDPGHIHPASETSEAGEHTHRLMSGTGGQETDSVHDRQNIAARDRPTQFYNLPSVIEPAGKHKHSVNIARANTGITIDFEGEGAEARPKNVAMLACIMY